MRKTGFPPFIISMAYVLILKNRIIDWRMYLLPAGESTYLGAVKSMVIDPYPTDEPLALRLMRRPKPLSCEYIILISRNLKLKDNLQVHPLPISLTMGLTVAQLPFHFVGSGMPPNCPMRLPRRSRRISNSGRDYDDMRGSGGYQAVAECAGKVQDSAI